MTATGRTIQELSASTRFNEDFLLSLLREDKRRGIVEEVDGHWKLTADAVAKYGDALRTFAHPTKEGT